MGRGPCATELKVDADALDNAGATFWPSYPLGDQRVEPDVLFDLGDSAILIEAKYGAAVLLHNRAGDDLGGLDEPVVTAGVLRGTNQGHWTAKAWAWTQHRHKDGEWEQFKFPDNSGRADDFALPLASIVSASSLELRVIRPLVEKAIRPADK